VPDGFRQGSLALGWRFSFWANRQVKGNFQRYSQIGTAAGMTGVCLIRSLARSPTSRRTCTALLEGSLLFDTDKAITNNRSLGIKILF
jgi:hypothetical protein